VAVLRRTSLLVVLVALLACGGPSDEGVPPDVVVICLDTLRADRLGSYGREPSITPHLDTFAATSTRFARTWATSPWTLPSHASLFTGQHSFEHGAHTVALDDTAAVRNNNVVPLSENALTLSERLRRMGYRTGAIVANEAYVTPRYGMDQGFEHFDVEMRFGPEINAAAEAWLRDDDERPDFLFLNYMDTHRPYNLTPRPGFVTPRSPEEGVRLLKSLYPDVLDGEDPDRRLQRLEDLYDLSVANLDDAIGDLFGRLRSLGRFDDALIVVLSDHGEFLGEHDLVEHSKDVYEPVLRVPMMIKAPGQTEGGVEATETSLVHVPYLVAQHLDVLPSEAFPYAWPARAVLAENHYTRIKDLRSEWAERFDRSRHVVIDWPWKYIRSSDGDHEVFHIERDPVESRDLTGVDRAPIEPLTDLLETRLENPRATFEQMNDRAVAPPELDPEEIERLRSLGYF
jgi:arylsulfatase A-like enzyme